MHDVYRKKASGSALGASTTFTWRAAMIGDLNTAATFSNMLTRGHLTGHMTTIATSNKMATTTTW